jgi:hypothetical protein
MRYAGEAEEKLLEKFEAAHSLPWFIYFDEIDWVLGRGIPLRIIVEIRFVD